MKNIFSFFLSLFKKEEGNIVSTEEQETIVNPTIKTSMKEVGGVMKKKYENTNFFIASTGRKIQVYVELHGSMIDRAVLFNKCLKEALEGGFIKEVSEASKVFKPSPYRNDRDIARVIFLPIINSYFEEKYGKIQRKLNLRHSVKRGLISEQQAKNILSHESFMGIIPLKFLMVVPEGSDIVALASKYDPNHVGSKSFVFNAKNFFGKTNKKLYTLHGDWDKDGVVFLDHKGLSAKANQMFIVKDKVANQATVITKHFCRTMPLEKVSEMIDTVSKEIVFNRVVTSEIGEVGSDGRNASGVDVVQVALAHGWTFPKISEIHPNAYKLYHEYSGGYYGGTKLLVAGNRTTRAHKFFRPVNDIQDVKDMGGYKFALGCYIAVYMQMEPFFCSNNCPEELRRVKKITTLDFFKGNEDVGILVVGDKNNFTYNEIMYHADYHSVEPITKFSSPKEALAQKVGLERSGFKNLRIFRRLGKTQTCYEILEVDKFKNQTTVKWLSESLQDEWCSHLHQIANGLPDDEGVAFPDRGWMESPIECRSSYKTIRGYLNKRLVKWDSSHLESCWKMVLVSSSGKIVAGARSLEF